MITTEDFELFWQQGYLRIGQDSVKQCMEENQWELYLRNISDFRHKASAFFQLETDTKKTLTVPRTLDSNRRYYSGYWPTSPDNAHLVNKTYVAEYLLSKDYCLSTEQDMYVSKEHSKKSTSLLRQLPHQAAFYLCSFWLTSILEPLKKKLISHLTSGEISGSLNIIIGHYPQKSELHWHQDKGFFMGLLGPNEGIKYKCLGSEQVRYVELEKGEIFIYTGTQFGEYLSALAQEGPKPMLHTVDAQAGRLSIIFNYFASLVMP